MTELINSLKTFAYSGSINYDRRCSSGQLRIIPLLNLGKSDSCADTGFTQWRDAMRMVARLPGGLPTEFRLKLWENLSEKYLQEKGILWSRVLSKCATPNSRDQEIADQIDKDLHRTGCTGFSRAKQAKLKTVLVSYGRWNPSVGYCQGFNMIGAMLLEMTSGDETLTLKVLIFLIEGVLPQGYFSGGLRGLAVDMAVFGEILKLRKPTLNGHLYRLQGGEDNPPLIDVFTMHWFLTLFIHCLPTACVLRIWDLVLLEGSEVLLRTALVLWAAIETRILGLKTADDFYSVMGVVTREMLENGLMDPNSLVKCIVSVGPFPFPGLVELRQKHRGLIGQETPYKSFFLAKRELDNLKKHYSAIKHRQKATTIILKGLNEASRMRVPGQRSNSLFIPTTKKQVVSPKPKLRRGSSGAKATIAANNNNNNNHNLNNSNVNNLRKNKVSNNGNSKGKQVTMKWEKGTSSSKVGKTFRRRRTLSASSMTSSSSSTELCDSSSNKEDSSGEGSSSEGVWSDSDNRWVKKKSLKKSMKKNSSFSSIEKSSLRSSHLSLNKSNLSLDKSPASPGPVADIPMITGGEKNSSSNLASPLPKSPLLLLPESKTTIVVDDDAAAASAANVFDDLVVGIDSFPVSPSSSDPGGHKGLIRSSSIIDTNDSQHFLEEMSKLGKSDSFYENLSKRICELQFQNLKTLSTCNTIIDPKALALPPFEKSPLPSPISPHPPVMSQFSGDNFLDVLTPSGGVIPRSPSSPRNVRSPRGSISGGESSPALPKSPISSFFSSPSSEGNTPSSLLKKQDSGGGCSNKSCPISRKTSKSSVSSVDIPDICIQQEEDSVEIPPDKKSTQEVSPISITQLPPSSNDFLESLELGPDAGLPLSPLVTSPSSPQKSSMKLDILENCCLISPTAPSSGPYFTGTGEAACSTTENADLNENSKKEIITTGDHTQQDEIMPRPKNFPVSPAEPDAFLFPEAITSESLTLALEGDYNHHHHHDNEDLSPSFPTATCACQCQTTEEINAVIRENIAILQRLKLSKAAYLDDDALEEDEDCSYEDASDDEEEDKDSGIPSSSKNSFNKGRLSSVSSNASLTNITLESSRRMSTGSGSGSLNVLSAPAAKRRSAFARNNSSSKDSLTSNKSNKSGKAKSNGGFNPFPTVRKARLRVSRYGLYN